MRMRSSARAAACVLAAALAAGGCAASSTTGTGTATDAASGGASASGGAAQSSSGAATATPPSTGVSASAASGSGANGGSTCQAANLSFKLGAANKSSSQSTQNVDLTNQGSSPCTMDGFPGVDLIGVANGQQNFAWSLERSATKYATVTLPPGGVAHFVLTYLPDSGGDSGAMTVLKLELTPPNTFTQAELTWNQAVLLQDGATHPGTFIGPIQSG